MEQLFTNANGFHESCGVCSDTGERMKGDVFSYFIRSRRQSEGDVEENAVCKYQARRAVQRLSEENHGRQTPIGFSTENDHNTCQPISETESTETFCSKHDYAVPWDRRSLESIVANGSRCRINKRSHSEQFFASYATCNLEKNSLGHAGRDYIKEKTTGDAHIYNRHCNNRLRNHKHEVSNPERKHELLQCHPGSQQRSLNQSQPLNDKNPVKILYPRGEIPSYNNRVHLDLDGDEFNELLTLFPDQGHVAGANQLFPHRGHVAGANNQRTSDPNFSMRGTSKPCTGRRSSEHVGSHQLFANYSTSRKASVTPSLLQEFDIHTEVRKTF